MKKEFKLLALAVVFILLFSISVYAVGRSEGVRNNNLENASDNNETNNNNNRTISQERIRQRLVERYQNRTCDDYERRNDRILCRLAQGENYHPRNGTIPEACQNLDNPIPCQNLYRNVQRCYQFEGTEKDRCFKKVIGFTHAKLADVNATGKGRIARDYMVVLLYDLQEEVEEKFDNGEITEEEALALINKITEIKQKILEGASKRDIQPLVQQLKQRWRSTFSSSNPITNQTNSNSTGGTQ